MAEKINTVIYRNLIFLRYYIDILTLSQIKYVCFCQVALASTSCENFNTYHIGTYSALRKYSAPLNFATFCHISGFKHEDIKLYFVVKNQQQVGLNHEVERHLLDISNFFNKSKTEKLGGQNYSAPLS